MTTRARILATVLLTACSRNSSQTSDSAPSAVGTAASATGFAAPGASFAAPAASPSSFAAPAALADRLPFGTAVSRVSARVKAWNEALDLHDASGLADLYFPRVCYYGRVITMDKVLAHKKEALGAGSSFRQQIVGDVEVGQAPGDFLVARFAKRSGPAARLRDTPARIVLRQDSEHGELRILEEADDSGQGGQATTDACTQAAWSALLAERCEEAASRAVNALPRVKRLVDGLIEASTDDQAVGGVGPQDNGDGTFSASIGVHTHDRFEGRVDYTVSRKTGHLTVSVDDTNEPVPEKVQQELATTCKP